jgi:hypothetical protein
VRVFTPKRRVFNNFYRLRGVIRHIDAQEEEREREKLTFVFLKPRRRRLDYSLSILKLELPNE